MSLNIVNKLLTYFSPNLVTDFVTYLVITRLVMNLSPNLVSNLVITMYGDKFMIYDLL